MTRDEAAANVDPGTDLATAAEALVGVPFRLHGRTEAVGLDCVGVVERALARTGRRPRLPNGYALRQRKVPALDAIFEGAGLQRVQEPVLRGDVLMLRPSPCQLHLAIATCPAAMIHAHAGLRKVVSGPRPAQWPCIGHWRLTTR